MRIVICDYGVGNLFSIEGAFARLGTSIEKICNADDIEDCDLIVLPGVAAFGDALAEIRHRGFDRAITEHTMAGRAFLGICLGAQALMLSSDESPGTRGLGLINGSVDQLPPGPTRVPNQGWMYVDFPSNNDGSENVFFQGLGQYYYFSHSYWMKTIKAGTVIATAATSTPFVIPAVIREGPILGTQFHPERSGDAGLAFLHATLQWAKSLSSSV